jgi:hypothetical protein
MARTRTWSRSRSRSLREEQLALSGGTPPLEKAPVDSRSACGLLGRVRGGDPACASTVRSTGAFPLSTAAGVTGRGGVPVVRMSALPRASGDRVAVATAHGVTVPVAGIPRGARAAVVRKALESSQQPPGLRRTRAVRAHPAHGDRDAGMVVRLGKVAAPDLGHRRRRRGITETNAGSDHGARVTGRRDRVALGHGSGGPEDHEDAHD